MVSARKVLWWEAKLDELSQPIRGTTSTPLVLSFLTPGNGGQQQMSPKKKGQQPQQQQQQLVWGRATVMLEETRSPVPFNSYKYGCSIELPVVGTNLEDYETAVVIAEDLAREGLKQAESYLAERLRQELRDGRIGR